MPRSDRWSVSTEGGDAAADRGFVGVTVGEWLQVDRVDGDTTASVYYLRLGTRVHWLRVTDNGIGVTATEEREGPKTQWRAPPRVPLADLHVERAAALAALADQRLRVTSRTRIRVQVTVRGYMTVDLHKRVRTAVNATAALHHGKLVRGFTNIKIEVEESNAPLVATGNLRSTFTCAFPPGTDTTRVATALTHAANDALAGKGDPP